MIEEVNIHMDNVLKRNMKIKLKKLLEIMDMAESFPTVDGIYKQGPSIIEFDSTELDKENMNMILYIPLNISVNSTSDFDYIPFIDIKGVKKRFIFNEGINENYEDIIAYINKKGYKNNPKMYFVWLPVYEDVFVDLIVEVEE